MNENTALILRDDRALAMAFTPQAFALKNAALESAALIGKVATPEQNEEAVKAQIAIAGLLKLVEEARTAAKAPVLKFGKTIDDTAKDFIESLKAEAFRLMELVTSYQQLQEAKARAAQKAEQERLDAIEKEKAKQQAAATTQEEFDKVAEKFDNEAKQQAPVRFEPPRAKFQTVKTDWEFEVVDLPLLTKAHWNLVTVEPKRGDIKALLRQGIKIGGIRAWQVTKAGVRVERERPAIEA